MLRLHPFNLLSIRFRLVSRICRTQIDQVEFLQGTYMLVTDSCRSSFQDGFVPVYIAMTLAVQGSICLFCSCCWLVMFDVELVGLQVSKLASMWAGQWVYEVLLGSKGVMQIGWCTLKCKFSTEVNLRIYLFNEFAILIINYHVTLC